jgi:hypothetical protein
MFLPPEFKLIISLWFIAYNEPQRNAAHMICSESLIVNEILSYFFVELCAAFQIL